MTLLISKTSIVSSKPLIVSNVLEHVQNNLSAINNIYQILNKIRNFVILASAQKVLYYCSDVSIGHFLRYTKK